MTRKKLVVFDLDGTLADDSERLAHLQEVPKNWKRYFERCAEDLPVWPMIHAASAFWRAGWQVEIWTGRNDSCLDDTVQWLADHDVKYDDLRMRPAHDHRANHELKGEWLDQYPYPPELIFEDLPDMVAYWRSRGICCCQVADRDVARLADEAGDVLWYLAQLCEEIGVPLEVVAQKNLEKLAERYRSNGRNTGGRT